MCGITGIAFAKKTQSLQSIQKMMEALHHRGPDAGHYWESQDQGVALGHRRLAIIDLTVEGQQPMTSANKRYVIVLNGEIYNFRILKKELESLGIHFHGHSDTEVLLEAIAYWGIEQALKRSIGMFAFAVWDKHTNTLHLARDRFGEKPLYYGWTQGGFIFGSELKSLKQFSTWKNDINKDALASYLRYGYVPTPYSIYKNVHKLKPGTYLSIQGQSDSIETIYWSAADAAMSGLSNPFSGSFAEALDLLEAQLKSTIQMQQVADVPLGAFLSGGIDSSTVVALMQSQSAQPIKTFSIGFEKESHNEAPFAKAIAQHLGTDHTELYASTEDAMAVVPLLATIYDEPFADSSQIPTYLVSKLAKKQVTVSLSGDGGDELFGGYKRYLMAQQFWNKIKRLPFPIRKAIGTLLGLSSSMSSQQKLSFKLKRLSQLLKGSYNQSSLNQMLMSAINEPQHYLIAGSENAQPPTPQTLQNNFIEMMMFSDTQSYLLDDILTKVDRAAMAVSLETRVPLLDHHVYELAWQLPLDYKIKGNSSKYILRKLLARYVPESLFERPKMGFGIPLDLAKPPLRDWAESLLDPIHLSSAGLLNVTAVQKLWKEYLQGQNQHHAALWYILIFNDWLQNQ